MVIVLERRGKGIRDTVEPHFAEFLRNVLYDRYLREQEWVWADD